MGHYMFEVNQVQWRQNDRILSVEFSSQ